MKGTSPGIVHVRGNMDYKTKRRFAFKQNPWRPHVTMFQKHFWLRQKLFALLPETVTGAWSCNACNWLKKL